MPRSAGHLLDVTLFWSARGGGVARYLHSKRRWLQTHSHWRHTIAVPGAPHASTADMLYLPSLPVPFTGGYRFASRRRLCARLLAATEPTVIEAGDPYRLAWSALDAGQRLGVPVVATAHSNVPALAELLLGRAARAVAARYLRHAYAGMDLVLAPSRWMADQLRASGIERVMHQPLGVDCQCYRPDRAGDEFRRRWRVALGLAPDAKVLVYAGRFAPEKHLPVLVEATRRLGPGHALVLVGAGPHTPPSESHVRVLPFVARENALARLLAASDVFVHAGDQETFGLALVEAMACGTPVVARHAAGVAELLDPACSAGVHSGGADAYAQAMASLLTRLHTDGDAIRAAARAHAERFDWHQSFQRLFSLYAGVTRTGGASVAREPVWAG